MKQPGSQIESFYFGDTDQYSSRLIEKLGSNRREKITDPHCCGWCNGGGVVCPTLDLLVPTKYNLDGAY